MISRISWVALKLETLSGTVPGRGWYGALPSCHCFLAEWFSWIRSLNDFKKKIKIHHSFKFEATSALPQENKPESTWTVLSDFSQRYYWKQLSNSDQRQTRCPVLRHMPSCGHQCVKKWGTLINSRWLCPAHGFPAFLVLCTATCATLKQQVSHQENCKSCSLKTFLQTGTGAHNVYFKAIMASPIQKCSWFGNCCADIHLASHLLKAMWMKQWQCIATQ